MKFDAGAKPHSRMGCDERRVKRPFSLSEALARRMQDEEDNMAIPFETPGTKRDARAVKILAKTIYKELRTSGLDEKEVMSLAGELLGLVSSEVRSRQPVLASVRRRPAGQACRRRRAPGRRPRSHARRAG